MVYYNIQNEIKNSKNLENLKQQKIKVFVLTFSVDINKKPVYLYNYSLMGQKIIDYVLNALQMYSPKILKHKQNTSLIELLTPYTKNCDYIALFYCDTPLINADVVQNALDYATLKQLDICKLPRGYVFKSSFLKNYIDKIESQSYNFYDEFFTPVTNFNELEKAEKQIKQNINLKHQLNGVRIIDSNSTYIEKNVEIESGVTIYPNNYLHGNTKIGKGTILGINNVIINSKISQNCKISNSILNSCTISKNVKLKPFFEYDNLKL